MLCITWVNVRSATHFITVAKCKMYCMGVKSRASGLIFVHQKQYFLIPNNIFYFFQILLKKTIALLIFNLIRPSLKGGICMNAGQKKLCVYDVWCIMYDIWPQSLRLGMSGSSSLALGIGIQSNLGWWMVGDGWWMIDHDNRQ